MDNIVNWIFGIIGAIGTLLAVISYVQTRWLKKIPMKAFMAVESIDKNDLNITINGEVINNLSVSYLIFWNDGGNAITAEDYSANKLPCIQCDDKGKILSYSVVDVFDNDFVNLRTKIIDDKNVYIEFDKIGYKQGFAIRIVHTYELEILIKLNGIQVRAHDDIPNQIFKWTVAVLWMGLVATVFGYILTIDTAFMSEWRAAVGVILGALVCAFAFIITNTLDSFSKLPKRFRKYLR